MLLHHLRRALCVLAAARPGQGLRPWLPLLLVCTAQSLLGCPCCAR